MSSNERFSRYVVTYTANDDAMLPALIAENLPQFLAAPLLQFSLIAVGVLLERTYVNRATTLAGAVVNYKLVEELAPAKPYFWDTGERDLDDGIDLDDVEAYVDRARAAVESRTEESEGDTAR